MTLSLPVNIPLFSGNCCNGGSGWDTGHRLREERRSWTKMDSRMDVMASVEAKREKRRVIVL